MRLCTQEGACWIYATPAHCCSYCMHMQVVLAFGLRSALQCSWQELRSSANCNTQCVEDAHILLDVTHLLQELDVSDDGTKPSGYHTQERMREVFGLGEYRHEHARNLLQLKLCSRREHWATIKKPVV